MQVQALWAETVRSDSQAAQITGKAAALPAGVVCGGAVVEVAGCGAVHALYDGLWRQSANGREYFDIQLDTAAGTLLTGRSTDRPGQQIAAMGAFYSGNGRHVRLGSYSLWTTRLSQMKSCMLRHWLSMAISRNPMPMVIPVRTFPQ